jgi:hypothetical protein
MRLLAAAFVVMACGCGTSNGGTPTPSPALSASPGEMRVSQIKAAIDLTNTEGDQFVTFTDTSDLQKDGIDRTVQFLQPGTPTHVEVLCSPVKGPCVTFGARAQPLGFAMDPQRSNVYAKDNVPGTTTDLAVLTNRLFLDVLQASPDYQLSFNSATRKASPLPTPTP